MRDERLDYSYRNYSTKTWDVSKQRLERNLRLLYFHFGRYAHGARDDVAKNAYDVYISRNGGSDAIFDYKGF